MSSDEFFIKLAIRLAKRGLGWTNPNPLVGAVIVKNGGIIGQGFHHRVGYPHAEIDVLNTVSENPKGATLYVNLEPCDSFGKTPPCTDSIIKSDIKKVVCSTLDPNPKNHGKGLDKLQRAGIDTVVGILEEEARDLNEVFFTFHEKKRPFVALKFASSLDGKIATRTGDSKWITNEKARNWAKTLRGQYQAILVGINTVVLDNPSLNVRSKGKKDPVRIILDPKLHIPPNAQVLQGGNTIITTTTKADQVKKEELEKMGVKILVFEDEHISMEKLLAELRRLEIISILVEGGGKTLGNFIDAKMVDKVYAFHAPLLIGGRKATSTGGEGVSTISQALYLKNIIFKKFDDNLLTIGDVV